MADETPSPSPNDARAMYRAATVRDKRLLVLPFGGHGTSMLKFRDQASKLRAAVTRFLADHLGR